MCVRRWAARVEPGARAGLYNRAGAKAPAWVRAGLTAVGGGVRSRAGGVGGGSRCLRRHLSHLAARVVT